jgi:group I intron endonuclease
MPVIYKITSPSNKIYIGQTWNWYKRKSNYRGAFCEGQVFLYHSLIKYGFDSHITEIIEDLLENISQEELDNREIYWWNYYKDLGFEMLNIKEPGRGGKHSEETKRKISNNGKGRIPWNKGMKYSEEMSKRMISYLKRNPPGWKMPEEAKKKIGLANKGRIYPRKPCSEETKRKIAESNRGRKMPEEHRLKLIGINKGRKVSEETKEKIKLLHKRPIVILDLEGIFINEFDYISDATIFLGFPQNNYINNLLSGKNKTCKGYQFILKNEYDPNKNYRIGRGGTKSVNQYDLNGNFIKTFMSAIEAQRELNLKSGNANIGACCKGRVRQAFGYKWKYNI